MGSRQASSLIGDSNTMPSSDNKVFIVVGGVVGVVALLLVVLLPMSFVTLEYHEFGFKRQKSTGSVDTDEVFSGGKYFLGPDFEFKVFNAGSHFVSLRIDVFTADKLEVTITCHFQYFIRKDELPLLHAQFDIVYEDVISSSAVDAIKGAVPVYNTRELVSKRALVEAELYRAIRRRLGGICCRPNCEEYQFACPPDCEPISTCTDSDKGLNVNVKFFQLTKIEIPNDVEDRYMEALVLQEKGLREKLLQNATVIRKETQAMVQSIQNEALEIQQEADAESNKIQTVAQADYTNTIEKARGAGLKGLYTSLGINTQAQKNSFDYLRTLRGLDNVHLTVDFQQRIAGNLGSKVFQVEKQPVPLKVMVYRARRESVQLRFPIRKAD